MRNQAVVVIEFNDPMEVGICTAIQKYDLKLRGNSGG